MTKIPWLIASERATGVTDWRATPGRQPGEVTGSYREGEGGGLLTTLDDPFFDCKEGNTIAQMP